MKPVLTKLLKPYEITLDQYFKINSGDELDCIKEEIFYAVTHRYPTQNLDPNTTIDIPLELFDVNRKNLKLVYLVNQVDNENRKIKAKLNQLRTIEYYGINSNPPFNINVLIKDKYYVVLKVLLEPKVNGVKCSKQKTREIRKECQSIFISNYSEISQVLKDIYNKSLTQKICSKMVSNSKYIKSVIVQKMIYL